MQQKNLKPLDFTRFLRFFLRGDNQIRTGDQGVADRICFPRDAVFSRKIRVFEISDHLIIHLIRLPHYCALVSTKIWISRNIRHPISV